MRSLWRNGPEVCPAACPSDNLRLGAEKSTCVEWVGWVIGLGQCDLLSLSGEKQKYFGF